MDPLGMVITVVKVAVILVGVISLVPIMTWVERRGSAFIQLRLGPNRVGPFGLFQPVADGLKFFFKEDVTPPFVHKPTYIMAPGIALAAAIACWAVIPVGGALTLFGRRIPLYIADPNAGVLMLLAASSVGVYGIILAGWSSNNKYSQFGGLRSSSQMISYELSLGLAVISVLIFNGSLRLTEIVAFQAQGLWNIVYLPVGFLLLLISAFAETNRLPFDLPEAESELVGGYHTEYSSMKFAMFFMAEYLHMITASALMVTLFLGGYAVPRFVVGSFGLEGNLLALVEVAWFVLKMGLFLWLFVWVRWTLPRFRFDQLMHIGWKILIPVGLLNALWAALLVVWGVGP